MTADKNQPTAPAEPATRKTWIPKTPLDIVLEQIAKQDKKVVTLQKELDQQKTVLVKLNKAKVVLEA